MKNLLKMILLLGVLSWMNLIETPIYSQVDNAPKNVILMIIDGCSYYHVDAVSYYEHGEKGAQIYEQFPVQLAMSTYNINRSYDADKAWSDFDYVKEKPTDSAAAATAMSTSVKTVRGYLGVDEKNQPLELITERMEKHGKSTGVVTTVPISHATPAGFVAHHNNRGDYAIIANQMLRDSKVDVIIGAGHPFYDDNSVEVDTPEYRYVGGKDTWDLLVDKKLGNNADNDEEIEYWQLITEKEEFKRLMSCPTPERIFGVFKTRSTLQQGRSGDASADPYAVPLTKDLPELSELSLAAINVLDNNPNGFFLMIEGGAVDWASHANQSGRMIEELMDFNKTVNQLVAWVEENSSWDETLLMITEDHECGYLTGPLSGTNYTAEGDSGKPQWAPIVNNGKGVLPGMEWHSNNHTNSLVPFYAKGVGSELLSEYADEQDPVRGSYIDNTEITELLFSLYP
ncbi:alkaline phosphatase [candidate division KSB1 bacterium]|nr:alkaline phosphatase [candidate division KSB1 bacterium]